MDGGKSAVRWFAEIAAPADGSVAARTEFSAQPISSAAAYNLPDLATVRKEQLVARAQSNRTAASGSGHPRLFDWFAPYLLCPQ
jgi:hypothetical protein